MAVVHKCQWCGQVKMPLPEKTEKQGLEVYVCTKPVGKNKIPCDGNAFEMATKEI